MKLTDFVYFRINGMPCVNSCGHCFLEASPLRDKPFMSEEKINLVLDKAADYKNETGTVMFPNYFDEPSLHPAIVRVIDRQLKLGLTIDEFFFPTNGYGFARMKDDEWAALAESGFSGIRFTFYGTGPDHDSFAGREGAYADLVRTAERAEEFGIEWMAGVMLHPGVVNDYPRIKSSIEELGSPSYGIGWMIPNWHGRSESTDVRVTIDQLSPLLQENSMWKSEGQHIEAILSDRKLSSNPAYNLNCGMICLDIDTELNVHLGGGCDGNPFAPVRDDVALGVLGAEGFPPLIENLFADPPEPVKLLSGTTWGELAGRYGDTSGKYVFHAKDLVAHKWGKQFFEEEYIPASKL